MKRLLFLFLPLMLIMSSCKRCDRCEDDNSKNPDRCSRCGKKSDFYMGQPPKCSDCWPLLTGPNLSPLSSRLPLSSRFPATGPGLPPSFLMTECSCCHKKCNKLHQPDGICPDCYDKKKKTCSYCNNKYVEGIYGHMMLGEQPGRCPDCRYKQKCNRCNKEYEDRGIYCHMMLGEQPGRCPDCRYKQKCSRCNKEYEGCGALLRPFICPACCKQKCSRCNKEYDKRYQLVHLGYRCYICLDCFSKDEFLSRLDILHNNVYKIKI
jgi:hypothetical protein